MQHLVGVLRDENEYARRAAVEVLNEIGNAEARQVPAAVHQGRRLVGPQPRAPMRSARSAARKVIDAVLQLVRDKDEDVRRAAIEILNQTKDERAVGYLIEATRDNGLVGERARRRCARRDRQHASAARALEMLLDTTDEVAAGRWCARSASSATPR